MQCALRLLTRTTQIFSQHWAVELSAINISKWTSLTGRTGIQSFLLRLYVLIVMVTRPKVHKMDIELQSLRFEQGSGRTGVDSSFLDFVH
jgi:hypothetical protein